jgi:hypothetical protein
MHNSDRREQKGLHFSEVKALCDVNASTKSATSIGFMGIGFKSLFERFSRVDISSGQWSFYLKEQLDQFLGKPDPIGMVLPLWDQSIPKPDPGYTTRFCLKDCWPNAKSVEFELEEMSLCVLALVGLKEIQLGGRVWTLGLKEELDKLPYDVEAMRVFVNKSEFLILSVGYTPSNKAAQDFINKRGKVYLIVSFINYHSAWYDP